MTLTTFVADDEPLARRKLAELIVEVAWAEQVGEAADGVAAVEAINELRPDIVFLDIRMPELSGLETLQRLTCAPAIVFTTAYSEFAVAAFELEAVDYLLKPFGRRRFLAAAERARRVVDMRGQEAALERARAVLDTSRQQSLERILVRDHGKIVPLAPAEIERLEAEGDYVMLYAREHHYLMNVALGDLEARLPNPPFLRIHRSYIVNLDHVAHLVPHEDGARLLVRMKDGTQLIASRARSRNIRRMSR
jgi:two-component system LytT family response regulator